MALGERASLLIDAKRVSVDAALLIALLLFLLLFLALVTDALGAAWRHSQSAAASPLLNAYSLKVGPKSRVACGRWRDDGRLEHAAELSRLGVVGDVIRRGVAVVVEREAHEAVGESLVQFSRESPRGQTKR